MSEIQTKPSNNPMGNKKRNPYTVWFVVLAFIAPVVLAYIMFFFVDVRSFVNHGEILNPIVNIDTFKLKNESGELIDKGELTYKWRLISFLGKDCNQQCEARLHDTHQIHTSLGKNQHRLLRMFIHLQVPGEPLIKLTEEKHGDVIHVYGEKKIILEALGKNIKDGVGITSNETYIMDPMGNVMMRFTVDQPNKEFLYDLKKLLKASQIG
jgi:cytochrome oxidase Cu insertion factor (SCO1/SenC/PrrC family)